MNQVSNQSERCSLKSRVEAEFGKYALQIPCCDNKKNISTCFQQSGNVLQRIIVHHFISFNLPSLIIHFLLQLTVTSTVSRMYFSRYNKLMKSENQIIV